jgi:hypothetical protein
VRPIGLGVLTSLVLLSPALLTPAPAQQFKHRGGATPAAPRISVPAATPRISAPAISAPRFSAPARHIAAPTPRLAAPATLFSPPHVAPAPHVARAPHMAAPRFRGRARHKLLRRIFPSARSRRPAPPHPAWRTSAARRRGRPGWQPAMRRILLRGCPMLRPGVRPGRRSRHPSLRSKTRAAVPAPQYREAFSATSAPRHSAPRHPAPWVRDRRSATAASPAPRRRSCAGPTAGSPCAIQSWPT